MPIRRLAERICIAVELRMQHATDFSGADRGGHEGFGKPICQLHQSLDNLHGHRGLHLRNADRETNPELAD